MAEADEFVTTFEDLLALNPKIDKVISAECWEYLGVNNKATTGKLGDTWLRNIRKNLKAGLWEKHGGIFDALLNFGFNKAVIAVGGGPSYNKNKQILKDVVSSDGVRPWFERDFYIISSNHMYKTLLKDGVIPDFVILADGSDVVYDQLCKNIPGIGQHTILLAGLHCSSKVLKEWTRQGRSMKFFMNKSKGQRELFHKITGEDPENHAIIAGGNVLNSAWVIALQYLGSTTFICVGNDLCFPVKDTLHDQRAEYYADGDYSTNTKKTGSGRDEARSSKRWMGIDTIKPRQIINPSAPNQNNYDIGIGMFGMPFQMWVYKTWIESQILIAEANEKKSFHYYNCTEGGTLGVLNKELGNVEKNYKDTKSWFLLDEMSKRYHTAMLGDAATWFKMAKIKLNIEQPQGVLSVPNTGLIEIPTSGAKLVI